MQLHPILLLCLRIMQITLSSFSCLNRYDTYKQHSLTTKNHPMEDEAVSIENKSVHQKKEDILPFFD